MNFPEPKVGDVITIAGRPPLTITWVDAFSVYPDGLGWPVEGDEPGDEGVCTTLFEADYGTPLGWGYVR